MRRAGSRPVGLDFSLGMLRVSRRNAPHVPVARADLNRKLPVRRERFDALLCSLVSERLGAVPHTTDDFLLHMDDAGFARIRLEEHRGDEALAREVPKAAKYVGRPLLLVIEAQKG